jgi:hypothetical protein
MTNIMAFNDHNSGFFHSIPVTTQNTHANDNIAMLSGYTSRLVNTTPTTVMILANHPISLLLFLKNVNYFPLNIEITNNQFGFE